MTLDRLPGGARVFLDATIFVYHATAASLECRALLERCEAGDLLGVTSVVVVAEVAHRLMTIEAVARGLVTGKDIVKKLRARPASVRSLHVYQEQVERIPLMGIDVLGVEMSAVLRSADIRRTHGLMVNDSLVVAVAELAGIRALASADRDFDRVAALELYQPGDL